MIANGHPLSEVKNYTLKQFYGFLECLNENEKEKIKVDFMVQRYSNHGDQKAIESFLDTIDGKVRKASAVNLAAFKR